MEASRQRLFPGMAAAPLSDRGREPSCEIVKRVARNATVALILANFAGGVVTFALGAWVVPAPPGVESDANMRNNLIGFGVALVVGLVLGPLLGIRASRESQGWLREDRTPTARERDATLSFPMRQTTIEAGLWALCAVEFFFINLIASDT